ncbi:unnamed protein product [Durusdinium trenchii]|uniref:Nucleotide-diphospho-sugar transferase domain-containing protein n=1 Tax=Durusdinium trenchii TaxID=1381693 RepID=A0ABP0SYX2_9DINO
MRCLGSGAWARVLCLLLAALASYAVFTTWTREKKEKPRKSKGKTTGSVSTTTAGSTTTTGEPEEDLTEAGPEVLEGEDFAASDLDFEVQPLPRKRQAEVDFHERVLPLQFDFQLCDGLADQRFQLIDGLLAGLFLGAQVSLPREITLNGAHDGTSRAWPSSKPLWRIFNMDRLQRELQELYSSVWCRRTDHRAHELWCGNMSFPAIVYNDTGFRSGAGRRSDRRGKFALSGPTLRTVDLEARNWKDEELMTVGEQSWIRIASIDAQWQKAPEHIVRMKRQPCDFPYKMNVVEGGPFWPIYWKIDAALSFSWQILDAADAVARRMMHAFGHVAQKSRDRRRLGRKASQMGHPLEESGKLLSGFNMVHLRVEKDWPASCARWSQHSLRIDNCMSNTFQIGNVLLLEGVNPALPVYLVTELSAEKMQELKKDQNFTNFFQVYTVVTKDMFSDLDVAFDDWPAIDYSLAQQADLFVGNSLSTFASLMLQYRNWHGLPGFHYNGGTFPLEDLSLLKPRSPTATGPVRAAIVWVFTLPSYVKRFDITYNMTMVALRSAKARTSLIPVCITTAEPFADMAVLLVSMGVRVLYHTPLWQERVAELATDSGFYSERDLEKGIDAVVSKLLVVDMPTMGFRDQLVMYTDLDVIFTGEVTWAELLGRSYSSLMRSLRRKMLSHHTFQSYALKGQTGVPMFFGIPGNVSRRSRKSALDKGVMLLNLRILRDQYKKYQEDFFESSDFFGSLSSSTAVLLSFYRDAREQLAELPADLCTTQFYNLSYPASITHFAGINCDADILPYLESGRVVFEPYRKRLSKCDDTAARTVVIRRSGVTGHGKRMEEVGTGRSTQAS